MPEAEVVNKADESSDGKDTPATTDDGLDKFLSAAELASTAKDKNRRNKNVEGKKNVTFEDKGVSPPPIEDKPVQLSVLTLPTAKSAKTARSKPMQFNLGGKKGTATEDAKDAEEEGEGGTHTAKRP